MKNQSRTFSAGVGIEGSVKMCSLQISVGDVENNTGSEEVKDNTNSKSNKLHHLTPYFTERVDEVA